MPSVPLKCNIAGKPFMVLPYSADASRPALNFVRSNIIKMELDLIKNLATSTKTIVVLVNSSHSSKILSSRRE